MEGLVVRYKSHRLKASTATSTNIVSRSAISPAMSAADTQLAGPPLVV
jgi:hypothetical protein